MSRQIILRPTSFNRRQPLLGDQDVSSRGGRRLAEVVGGTTAECAAVCCCCPCGLADLLFLAVYKVPAGLCRKALRRKRRRRLMEKGLLPREQSRCKCGCDDTELQIHTVGDGGGAAAMVMESFEMDEDVVELEKEMWDQFYGTGFWRSSSRRNE